MQRIHQGPGAATDGHSHSAITRLTNATAVMCAISVAFLAIFGWLSGDRLVGDEHNAIYFLKDGFWDYIRSFHYGHFLKAQFWTIHELFGNSFFWYRMPAALATTGFLAWLAFFRIDGLPPHRPTQALVALFIAGNLQFLFFARWGMPNYGESILVEALLVGSVLKNVAMGVIPKWTPWRLVLIALLPWLYPATVVMLGAISTALFLVVVLGPFWRQDIGRQAGGFVRATFNASIPLLLGGLSLVLYRLSRLDAHWSAPSPDPDDGPFGR